MNFPIAPLSDFVLSFGLITQSDHQLIALLGVMIGLISGFGRIAPVLVDGQENVVNQQFMFAGLLSLTIAFIFGILGTYALILLILLVTVWGLYWLVKILLL